MLWLVVGVSDGDTIKLRCGTENEEKIRLLQLDAPEKKQAFGTKAKQALSDRIFGKQVNLERGNTDRYGRTLGRITLDGSDINLEMVSSGYAWRFRKYLTDESCLAIEADAQVHRRGLWADASPVPPWEFRHPAARAHR